MPSRAWDALRALGPLGLAQTVSDRVLHRSMQLVPLVQQMTTGAAALEIGGPSRRFAAGGLVPVYGHLGSLDNVNFAGATLWEKDLRDGGPYSPAGKLMGKQYIREATDLHGLPDAGYDVVISSHTLEHLANPLKALREWRRVCRPDGLLVMVVPHRDGTFDRRRPITSLDHMRQDEKDDVDESDRTHVEEILRLHDLHRDPGVSSHAEFQQRLSENLATRAMHQHVFDLRTAADAVAEAGWRPLYAEARRPYDVAVVARNTEEPATMQLLGSPFPSDREATNA